MCVDRFSLRSDWRATDRLRHFSTAVVACASRMPTEVHRHANSHVHVRPGIGSGRFGRFSVRIGCCCCCCWPLMMKTTTTATTPKPTWMHVRTHLEYGQMRSWCSCARDGTEERSQRGQTVCLQLNSAKTRTHDARFAARLVWVANAKRVVARRKELVESLKHQHTGTSAPAPARTPTDTAAMCSSTKYTCARQRVARLECPIA